MFLSMLTFAQSIEVKYFVYFKSRKEVVNKIKQAKENRGYQELLNDLQAEKRDSFRLIVKGRMSSFEQIVSEGELSQNDGPRIIIVNPSYSEEKVSVYKSLVEMRATELKDLLGRTYSITHLLPHYQWKVSSKSKKIMGLEAYKATIGDSITAWFCPSIPVQDGPGLYYGLPGLILDLEDKHAIYTCTSINTKSSQPVAKPKRAKEVTKDQFEQLRKRAFAR